MRIDELFGLGRQVATIDRQPQGDQPRLGSLAALEQWADTQGVELDVVMTPMRIELHDIGRVVGAKGAGAAVMRALCALADDMNKPIALEALNDDPKRIAYFQRFGFRLAAAQPAIEGAGSVMVRSVA